MALLRSMATNLMLTRAVAASWPALKTTATRSNLGRAGLEAVLDEASIQEFARLVVDNYGKQVKFARAAGVGFAGAAAVTLAGVGSFGVHRLYTSIRRGQ